MRPLGRILVIVAVISGLASPVAVHAADSSQAMAQHMRLMEAQNPGMSRMMETGMGHMEDAPPFQMPPIHP